MGPLIEAFRIAPGVAEALRKRGLLLSSSKGPSRASLLTKREQVHRGKKDKAFLVEIMNVGCFTGWARPHTCEQSMVFHSKTNRGPRQSKALCWARFRGESDQVLRGAPGMEC